MMHCWVPEMIGGSSHCVACCMVATLIVPDSMSTFFCLIPFFLISFSLSCFLFFFPSCFFNFFLAFFFVLRFLSFFFLFLLHLLLFFVLHFLSFLLFAFLLLF